MYGEYMKNWFVIFVVLSLSFSSYFSVANQETDISDEYIQSTLLRTSEEAEENYELQDTSTYSPFFLLYQNRVLNYTPIVIIPNYDWYENNSLDYYSLTYEPEIKIHRKKTVYMIISPIHELRFYQYLKAPTLNK